MRQRLLSAIWGAVAALVLAGVTVLAGSLLFGIACSEWAGAAAWMVTMALIGAVCGIICKVGK